MQLPAAITLGDRFAVPSLIGRLPARPARAPRRRPRPPRGGAGGRPPPQRRHPEPRGAAGARRRPRRHRLPGRARRPAEAVVGAASGLDASCATAPARTRTGPPATAACRRGSTARPGGTSPGSPPSGTCATSCSAGLPTATRPRRWAGRSVAKPTASYDPETHIEQKFRAVLRQRLTEGLGATVTEHPGPQGNRWTINLGGRTWTLEPQMHARARCGPTSC